LYENSSARDGLGHIDLPGKPEGSAVTLRDTRRALLAGAVSVHEARVHAALVLDPEMLGLDAIEMGSGKDRKVLYGRPDRGTAGVIPAEGCSSILLHCSDRGVFSVAEDERRPMTVQPLAFENSSSGPHHIHKISTPLSLREGGVGGEGKDLGTRNGGQMTSSGEAPWVEQYERLLSPDRDLWSNHPLGSREALGDAGWAIALTYGFEAVLVPLVDLQQLLGKSAQQTQRIADKLGFARTKGRGAAVTVDLSRLVDEQALEEHWYDRVGLRAVHKATAANRKHKAVGRRGTPHGYAAYRVGQHREVVASVVEDRTWRSWVMELDEEQLADKLERYREDHGELPRWARDLLWAGRQYRHRGDLAQPYVEALAEAETDEQRETLRTLALRMIDAELPDWFRWTTEPAEVPDSPEELEHEPAVEEQQALAAMRKRITDHFEEQRNIVIEPAKPNREQQPNETEDDFTCRTTCMGRADLFQSVHGRLPNQSKPEPTAGQLKERRRRQAVEERRRSRLVG
jgi:hypothetical protein